MNYTQQRADRRRIEEERTERRIQRISDFLLGAVCALMLVVVIFGGSKPAEARAAIQKKPAYSRSTASCYGPGLYGNSTANGTTLTRSTIGVAHRSLAFGTKIKFRRGGRTVIAKVIDRGPFVSGRTFDLTSATVRRLGVSGCDSWGHRPVNWRIVR